MKLSRSVFNLFLDYLLFLIAGLLACTGLLMSYRLPPGSGFRRAVYGLSRHEWGSLHFYAGLLFIALALVHAALHWRWLVCICKERLWHAAAGAFTVFLLMAASLFLLLAPITELPAGRGRGLGHSQQELP